MCVVCNFKCIVLCSFPLLLSYIDDHPHLFAVDPLLLHFLVHAAPFEAYDELTAKVPLFILLAALTGKFSRDAKEKVYTAWLYIAIHEAHCTKLIIGPSIFHKLHALL